MFPTFQLEISHQANEGPLLLPFLWFIYTRFSLRILLYREVQTSARLITLHQFWFYLQFSKLSDMHHIAPVNIGITKTLFVPRNFQYALSWLSSNFMLFTLHLLSPVISVISVVGAFFNFLLTTTMSVLSSIILSTA